MRFNQTEENKVSTFLRYETARVRAHSVQAGMVLLHGGEVSKVETLPDRTMRIWFTHAPDIISERDRRFTHYPNLWRRSTR